MENSVVAPPKLKKKNDHLIQQFHLWVYIQKN